MLANLHVKNFAIIDEIDVDFGSHLNILTGETGAGKSILVGSIGIALGARVSPEMIGSQGDYAMVEIVFQIDSAETLRRIRQMDIEPEDNQIVISRKITGSRSINKINGESVPVSAIRRVAEMCLDIHGPHEHQSLLNKEKHLEIVDEYGGAACAEWKEQTGRLYRQYMELKKEREQNELSEAERARQADFLSYEKNEIEAAAIQPGEIEQAEETYRRAANAGTIAETLGRVHRLCGEDAAAAVSQGIRSLNEISGLDSALSGFSGELMQIEGLLGDFNREISEFMADFSFDEKELTALERRLDCIHTLQSKYGNTYEEIMDHLQEVDKKLEQYADYEAYREKCDRQMEAVQRELEQACENLTGCRREAAAQLEEKISNALRDLNFAHVDFEIHIGEREEYRADGKDDVEFLIATNPGEERKSLGKIASGGELSRIMLAIKSVFADSDQTETLIFDEIDAGISGRTAQKVSEKMNLLARRHQILCITHLPQIAAMADYHYVIEKEVGAERSRTRIRRLSREESGEELARLIGGVEITDAVRSSAREMKEMAEIMKTR